MLTVPRNWPKEVSNILQTIRQRAWSWFKCHFDSDLAEICSYGCNWQYVGWFGTGNKPLPEPIMIQFIAVIRSQYAEFNVLRICCQLVPYHKTINWAVSSVVGIITRFKSSCNNEMHHHYIYLILEYISCHTISPAYTPGDSVMFIHNDKMVRWLLLIFSWHILFPWLSIPMILLELARLIFKIFSPCLNVWFVGFHRKNHGEWDMKPIF